MVRIVAFAQRTRRAVRLYGLGGALARAARTLRSPAATTSVDPFDQQFGVDTAGVVRLEGLRVRGDRNLGVRYQPSEPDAVRRLIEGLPIAIEDFVFVDMGSGKGRVVLIASQMPFKRVVGVEFCEDLDEVARANLAAFPASAQSCGGVELVCMDAGRFGFPAAPLVLYFYNPFLEPTMLAVMDNLVTSLERSPRRVFIVMTGDTSLARIVLNAGFEMVRDGIFTRA